MSGEYPWRQGDPAAPDPGVAWAPAGPSGTATLPPIPPSAGPPPAPAAPPAWPQHPPAARRPRRAVWVVSGLAVLLAIASITISAVKLAAPPPAPVTRTVVASPPAFSPDQVAAAKAEACKAVMTIDDPITSTELAFVATLPNRDSPESKTALSSFQTVVMVETEYLRNHTGPATPKEISDAVTAYISALVALVDADTRGLPDAQANVFVDAARTTGAAVTDACRK
jgi:hypothetical protein